MVLEYLKLFATFAKIGMFTIGGGYAMIPLIEREIVAKQWMSKEEFMEMFALTQSLPGVFAVNISIFVGYKLYKIGGSLVCALATILPSFVIMMLIAMFFARFQDNEIMIRIFNGIRPAVVALILYPCISAARALKLKYFQLIAPVIATVAVCLPSFILVLLISYFFAKCKDNKYIKAAMSGLLPMSVALIASAALLMMNRENFIDYKSIAIFAVAFLVTWKLKLHPILLICLAGVVGLMFY